MADWRQALFERRTMGVRFGLEELRAVDATLGHPALAARRIQVLGTNGKGSTAAMLAHLLQRSGRKVGLFTSPHLHRVGERVRIDGVAVSDETIRAATERVLAAESVAGRQLSFFELLTMAAWLIFDDAGVQDVVLEAGLGGRLDSTSMRPCGLHLLTSVALDHEQYLGKGLHNIAREKTAVFHEGAQCFSGKLTPQIEPQVIEHARSTGEQLEFVTPAHRAPLPGDYQRWNAALALRAAEFLGCPASEFPWEGFAWPGRAESIEVGKGAVTLDVAHNFEAIGALVQAIEAGDLPKPDRIVVGVMADKRPNLLVKILGRLEVPIWWAQVPREGAAEPPEHVGIRKAATVDALTPLIERHAEAGECVLVCGSHFVVAPIRAHLLSIPALDIDAPELTDPVSRG